MFAGYPDTQFFLSPTHCILRLIFTTRRCVAIATRYCATGTSILRLQRRLSFVDSEGLLLLGIPRVTLANSLSFQDSEAQYVQPSMLAAFTQHSLPSAFFRLSPVIPNIDSAGPSQSQGFAVDLTPLQNSIMQRLDPNRLLCRFESSGAGKCQDRHCEDYHWSDLEPSGESAHVKVHFKSALILSNPFFQMIYLLNTFSNRSRALRIIIMEKLKQ